MRNSKCSSCGAEQILNGCHSTRESSGTCTNTNYPKASIVHQRLNARHTVFVFSIASSYHSGLDSFLEAWWLGQCQDHHVVLVLTADNLRLGVRKFASL